ncbi:MAG: Hsp33 family molecular chaperone HslO [Pseudomonadales bacterium]|jgi:molecular chaperone Hsp33|nr:Hsp33 family molecular chaperone HslO [Pseudomonadales bacterium]
MSDQDTSTRFIFKGADIRGNFVRISDSYRSAIAGHQYPEEIKHLLGEFLVAAQLMASTIKFEGKLTLQAKGNGAIRAVMAETSHDGKTRAIAQLAESAQPYDFASLKDGLLAVTIAPKGRQNYQSMVPMTGDNLAACLKHYFEQSEQLGTLFHLAVEPGRAAGMLIQQLPGQLETDEKLRSEHWRTTQILSDTLTPEELLEKDNQTILKHLFAEEDIQVLGATELNFSCSCSQERMAGALASLGSAELEEIFREEEKVELTCEFCSRSYEFNAATLTEILSRNEKLH